MSHLAYICGSFASGTSFVSTSLAVGIFKNVLEFGWGWGCLSEEERACWGIGERPNAAELMTIYNRFAAVPGGHVVGSPGRGGV